MILRDDNLFIYLFINLFIHWFYVEFRLCTQDTHHTVYLLRLDQQQLIYMNTTGFIMTK